MRALLIDDEQNTLALLKKHIQTYCPQISIIGTANSAKKAYDLITELKPDLVFLDIIMPNESGFDLLNRLPNLNFELIFVTSHDSYALQAIKFCAIGYIIKPVRVEELVIAVNTAQKRVSEKEEFSRNKQLLSNLINPQNPSNRIGIPTERGLEFVETSQIIRCEGVQRCTKVVVKDKKSIISSYNLGEFVKLLEPYNFHTIHKSHLINLLHVIRYDKEGSLEMTDGVFVPVARRRRQDFLEQLTRL